MAFYEFADFEYMGDSCSQHTYYSVKNNYFCFLYISIFEYEGDRFNRDLLGAIKVF